MKGDMGQENRQALDINLDSVVGDSCEPGLMSIAARLLKNGCTDMGSFVVSPACLYIAVETLARGAKGETLNELESVLGGAEARRDACSLLFAKDPEQTASDYRLAIATSLWANKFTSPLRRNFGRTIADLHGKAAEVDFESSEAKALMSSWLSRNTSGKFTSAPEMDADTVFAIISALYFKDSWVDPLDDEDVEVVFRAPEPQSDVAMMGGFGSYGHLLSTRETTAVSWPMQSGAVAVFARSNNGATLDDFVQSGAAWDAILRCHMRMGTTRPKGGIELFVPQFELRSDDRDLGGHASLSGNRENIFSRSRFREHNRSGCYGEQSRSERRAQARPQRGGRRGIYHLCCAGGLRARIYARTREGCLRPPVCVRHFLAFRRAIVCWGI